MTRKPLVVIANDQEWSARSLESILSPVGFRVVRAFTGQQALERVRDHQPDVVVLDAQMPDMHGFDVCRYLKEQELVGPATPIIITTAGPSGRAQRIDAFEAGAWEFFGQPLDGDALLLKLATFLRAKTALDLLAEESLLDTLTGLYSRKGLEHRAREVGSDACRRHEPLAWVVFGVETAGGEMVEAAPVGREFDARVGQLLRRVSRASDSVGRIAPGEYALLAPATGSQGAARLADRLTGALSDSSEQAGHLVVRAGYCAVPDFASSPVDAAELLVGAATALHDLQEAGNSERTRSFELPSVNLSSY